MAGKGEQRSGVGSRERPHDVSILIGLVGRLPGVELGSKVSMMIMRPPQHGHGNEHIGGASGASAAPVWRGTRSRAGARSSWGGREQFSVRAPWALSSR